MSEESRDGASSDVDPELVARVEDDFQRALRGEPRAVPSVPGVSTEFVEQVMARFGKIYHYDPASERPKELHEAVARVFWARVETEALRRLKATGRRLEEMNSSEPDLVRRIALSSWWAEVQELTESFTERLQVEGMLSSVAGEPGEASDLARRIYEMVDDWEPDLEEET